MFEFINFFFFFFQMSDKYKNTLFGCFDDISLCLYGLFCPLCLNSNTWAKIRKENCNFYHLYFSNSCFWNRQFFKSSLGMEINYLGDCIIFGLCTPCAICQDAREIKNRLILNVN